MTQEVTLKFNELGFVVGHVCPRCSSEVKFSHEDDTGTKFYKCEKCGEVSAKLKTPEKTKLKNDLKDLMKEVNLDIIKDILNSTIKHDEKNKLVTFLTMLLTYTKEDQINLSFTAESSTGKSYIPLELAWYFPKYDVLEYGYVSPTAFFHEYGTLLPDPKDRRNIKDEKKRKIILIDLSQKILIFMDQPHDMLLQRLRPLLSHDRKVISHKITDRRKMAGLSTKTVLIRGYCTVIFCTAKFTMEQQERTRLLLLSPETKPEKIRDAILLKIEKESNRKAFHEFMESDPKRIWLRDRVKIIRDHDVKNIIIPEELRNKIAKKFFKKHNSMIPRLQRDISRLLAMIKAHALLNCFQREQPIEHTILANETDMKEGFRLYEEFSAANELGLPPEVYNVFELLKDKIPENGVTKREFSAIYYETFHRTVGKKRLDQILNLLLAVGLLSEEQDPSDKRRNLYIVTPQGVFNSDNNKDDNGNNNKINTPQHVTTQQNSIAESAFYTHCSLCKQKLPNVEQHKKLDGKPVCDTCFKKHKPPKKQPQCKNLTTKEDQPFCTWLQSFLADPKQCNPNCDGWEAP
jgi:Zn ribbon nucleic-acid-binding protein